MLAITVNKELMHFSKYDCDRSIPNLMDGLKTSLRKILFAGFKKNLTKEIKVGKFQIEIPISIDSSQTKIKLLFSNTQRLPNNDDRIVGAYINKIGFVD